MILSTGIGSRESGVGKKGTLRVPRPHDSRLQGVALPDSRLEFP
jgi:hypothetical protein